MRSVVASTLTPAGRAAIATIVVEGQDAIAAVEAHLYRATVGAKEAAAPAIRQNRRVDRPWVQDQIVFASWVRSSDASTTAVTKEDVVVCRRAAHAYGDRVEVHCHGGSAAAQAILDDLKRWGTDIVPWPEWIAQAAPSRTVGEAQWALAHATTYRAARILLDQMNGALDRAMEALLQQIDCDSDPTQTGPAGSTLRSLVDSATVGMHLCSGWRVALVGPPNVGKSTLINAIAGFDRSLVHDTPGTTRDVLTVDTAIDGWPVQLADTAGIRDTAEPVEQEGVALARQQITESDAMVLVVDGTQPFPTEWKEFATNDCGVEPLVVWNKSDLAQNPLGNPPGVSVSALHRVGIDELLTVLANRLVPRVPAPEAAVLFTARQARLATQALQAIEANDLHAARENLRMVSPLAKTG